MARTSAEWMEKHADASDEARPLCRNCRRAAATECNGELCEPCACTVDWGQELPAGAELEPSVRTPGGGVFAPRSTDYAGEGER